MTTVTLSWDDPESAAEFTALRRDLRRTGWLSDPARDALVELVRDSRIEDGSEEGDGNAAV